MKPHRFQRLCFTPSITKCLYLCDNPLVCNSQSFPSVIPFQQEMHHIKETRCPPNVSLLHLEIWNDSNRKTRLFQQSMKATEMNTLFVSSIHNVKLYLSWLGQYSHGHGAGVHPALFFSPGNPLNSMDSSLKLHPLVALRAADAGRGVT